MFDPAPRHKEWPLPTPWSAPYDVVSIKNGAEVWTGSMLTDQVSRLDTATGQVVIISCRARPTFGGSS